MVEHPRLAPYVTRIQGGLDSVMGLDTRLLDRLLNRVLDDRTASSTTSVLAARSWAVVGSINDQSKQ